MLEFIYHYQTIISSLLIIGAGLYGYTKQRGLKEKDLEDQALATAINVQFKIEHMFYDFYSNAKIHKKSLEIGKTNYIEAINYFYAPVLDNPYVEENQFSSDWKDIGRLKFLDIEMTRIRKFYSIFSHLNGYTNYLKGSWATIDPARISKENFVESMDIYRRFFIRTVLEEIETLENLSEKTQIKTETTKQEKISKISLYLGEDITAYENTDLTIKEKS